MLKHKTAMLIIGTTHQPSNGKKGLNIMTLEQIKKLAVCQTSGVAADIQDNPAALKYVIQCLQRLYGGDYGEVPAGDTDANNAELAAGEGRIVARYKAAYSLREDIYIIAVFSESMAGNIDANNIMILYVSEY